MHHSSSESSFEHKSFASVINLYDSQQQTNSLRTPDLDNEAGSDELNGEDQCESKYATNSNSGCPTDTTGNVPMEESIGKDIRVLPLTSQNASLQCSPTYELGNEPENTGNHGRQASIITSANTMKNSWFSCDRSQPETGSLSSDRESPHVWSLQFYDSTNLNSSQQPSSSVSVYVHLPKYRPTPTRTESPLPADIQEKLSPIPLSLHPWAKSINAEVEKLVYPSSQTTKSFIQAQIEARPGIGVKPTASSSALTNQGGDSGISNTSPDTYSLSDISQAVTHPGYSAEAIRLNSVEEPFLRPRGIERSSWTELKPIGISGELPNPVVSKACANDGSRPGVQVHSSDSSSTSSSSSKVFTKSSNNDSEDDSSETISVHSTVNFGLEAGNQQTRSQISTLKPTLRRGLAVNQGQSFSGIERHCNPIGLEAVKISSFVYGIFLVVLGMLLSLVAVEGNYPAETLNEALLTYLYVGSIVYMLAISVYWWRKQWAVGSRPWYGSQKWRGWQRSGLIQGNRGYLRRSTNKWLGWFNPLPPAEPASSSITYIVGQNNFSPFSCSGVAAKNDRSCDQVGLSESRFLADENEKIQRKNQVFCLMLLFIEIGTLIHTGMQLKTVRKGPNMEANPPVKTVLPLRHSEEEIKASVVHQSKPLDLFSSSQVLSFFFVLFQMRFMSRQAKDPIPKSGIYFGATHLLTANIVSLLKAVFSVERIVAPESVGSLAELLHDFPKNKTSWLTASADNVQKYLKPFPTQYYVIAASLLIAIWRSSSSFCCHQGARERFRAVRWEPAELGLVALNRMDVMDSVQQATDTKVSLRQNSSKFGAGTSMQNRILLAVAIFILPTVLGSLIFFQERLYKRGDIIILLLALVLLLSMCSMVLGVYIGYTCICHRRKHAFGGNTYTVIQHKLFRCYLIRISFVGVCISVIFQLLSAALSLSEKAAGQESTNILCVVTGFVQLIESSELLFIVSVFSGVSSCDKCTESTHIHISHKLLCSIHLSLIVIYLTGQSIMGAKIRFTLPMSGSNSRDTLHLSGEIRTLVNFLYERYASSMVVLYRLMIVVLSLDFM
ncbi:unnamed protein product [Calicophoron daubneyi]|uniref:Uncharacterized protein n=1 Tax=Calicophoron daubneyi TaxID=300641 RepID=A0AAV2TUA8_CALDB